MSEPTREELLAAYKEGIEKDGFPDFCPGLRCGWCGRDLLEGVTLEQARNMRPTGCGRCCRSFCE